MKNRDDFNLDSFIDFLFGGLEGYAYLAAMEPGKKESWQQEFFHYPTNQDLLKRTIRTASNSHEIYLSPSLFKNDHDATRENFKVTQVVWTEFDGNAPDWKDSHGEPSLIIQSSGPLNQHCYWKLTAPVGNVQALEDINRRIMYNMQADSSAWDCTQVLRPPETTNHKRGGAMVFPTAVNDVIYDLTVFESLAPAPEQVEGEWELTSIPDPQVVVFSYAFTPDLIKLFQKPAEEVTDRSASLMNMAYACAQLGMSNNEIMSLLILADNKWGKFKDRKDRLKRLAHIITVARNKYPEPEADSAAPVMAFGFESFLATDIEVDWLIEGLLMENGNMLMVGPSGIGKSQLTLQFMIHLALGKDFLHYKIPEAKKIIFLSLEMGHGELKVFLVDMAKGLTDEEKVLLEENFIVIPYGEPWYLNTKEGQNELIKWIESVEPDGIAVDSIGSSIQGNISSDESVQPFTEFNDRIRKRYNLFTWYIHHMRKVRDGAATQDDVYGNQYLLNRSTSSYGILPAKGGMIKVRNFKQRMAKKEEDYTIVRGDNLMFHGKSQEVDDMLANLTADTPVSDKEGGFDL